METREFDPDPQAIALMLAVVPSRIAGGVLGGLPDLLRADVALAYALLDHAPPTVIEHAKQVLRASLDRMLFGELDGAGGVEGLAQMLMHVDRSTEYAVVRALRSASPTLANDVRSQMVSFRSVLLLDDRDVQVLLREVEFNVLATALHDADEEVCDKFFRNMSMRAAEMLREDMAFMKPRWNDPTPKQAQLTIASILRRLEEAGKILLSRSKDPRDEG